MNGGDIRNFAPGTHSACIFCHPIVSILTTIVSQTEVSRDIVADRRDVRMQLSFFLDVLLRNGDSPLNHNVAAHSTVRSAADVAGTIPEPKTLALVSGTINSTITDAAITVQSAYATAESVVAYYAPLSQALELVDYLLNAVSTLAEVSIFYITKRMFIQTYI